MASDMKAKGQDDIEATLVMKDIDSKLRKFEQEREQGQGLYILTASSPSQEAYALREENHSIFTRYLLEGLKGQAE